MRKSILVILVMTALVSTQLSAQEFSETVLSSGSLNFDTTTFDLVPLQSSASEQFALERGAAMAGYLNTFFGIWSWGNGDIFGGTLTTVLELGGMAIMIVPMLQMSDSLDKGKDTDINLTSVLVWSLVGTAVMIGGMIFGYIRGTTQYKAQHAATRTAWTGNPLDHVSFDFVPDGGRLSFKVGF